MKFTEYYFKENDITTNPNFMNWFKGSKVVDKKGNPLIVYHGTSSNFEVFRRGDIGFHFGTKKMQARHRSGFGKKSNVLMCYLKITNPLIIERDLGDWEADHHLWDYLYKNNLLTKEQYEKKYTADYYHGYNSKSSTLLRKFLVENGYDGIKYQNRFEGSGNDYSYIAFFPNQIKSINNKGSFNPESNNINEGNCK